MQDVKNGSEAVHNYTEADQASGGKACADIKGTEGTAVNFLQGVHEAGGSMDVSPGVFGEGFTKSG